MRLILSIIFLLSSIAVYAKTTVIFYNSDSNIRDYGKLKGTMEKYLTQATGETTRVIPVINANQLAGTIRNQKAQFIIISYDAYRAYRGTYGFVPQLVPTRGSSLTFEKLVVGLQNENKSSQTLATASITSQKKKIIQRLTKSSLRILILPRELDALMALRFRQADIAFVSKANYNLFKRISRGADNNMNVIKVIGNIPNSPFCSISKNNPNPDQINKYKKAFANMHASSNGKSLMRMLSIDKWVDRIYILR